jgi:hypothetical protein
MLVPITRVPPYGPAVRIERVEGPQLALPKMFKTICLHLDDVLAQATKRQRAGRFSLGDARVVHEPAQPVQRSLHVLFERLFRRHEVGARFRQTVQELADR